MVDELGKLSKRQLIEKLRSPEPRGGLAGAKAVRFNLSPGAKPPGPPKPPQERQSKPADWSLRKGEWACATCGTYNFLSRMDCRKCKRAWARDCELIPAGSPPPTKPKGAVGADGRTQPDKEDHVQTAEDALQAMKQAKAPPELIEKWQAEVAARREAALASKPTASLPARLAEATASHNATIRARDMARSHVTQIREQLQKAEAALEEAEEAAAKAMAHFHTVSAEVGSANDNSDAEKAPMHHLHALLKAVEQVQGAAGTDGEAAARDTLLTIQEAAKAAVTAAPAPTRPQVSSSTPMEMDKASGKSELPASPADADAARQAQSARLAASRQKQAEESAEALMKEMEEGEDRESKKARLTQALNQAWGDAPFQPTQKQAT